MASTYTTNLGIEKIGTGEQSGTWGDTTNTNFDILDEAINGIISVTLSSAGSSGSPTALPITDGASSNGRNKFIEFVDGGDLGGTAYVQLTPNNAEKVVHIRNSLSSSRSVIVFQGTYNASNDFEIVNGADVLLKFNGGGSGATVTDVNVDLTVTGATIATADINGGTIDGAVIGGASAAAGTFTTITGTTITASTAAVPDASDGATLGSASLEWSDLYLADGAVVFFGDDQDITLTHVADTGLTLKHANTGDDKFPTFLLATGDTDIAANDKLGVINFQAPDEGAGTDAILVAAGIEAVSEGDFSASSNATSLVFKTGASEAAAEKMRVNSAGNVGIGTASPNTYSNYTTLTLNGSASSALDFEGGGTLMAEVLATANDLVLQTAQSDGELIFKSAAGSEAMRISSAGDVSIGSSSNHTGARVVINDTPPTAFGSPMFQVGQETFTGSGMYSIGFGYTAGSYTEPPVEIAALTTSDSGGTKADIVFGTRNATTNTAVTERMRITAAGNVGIGTTSPTNSLHVAGAGTVAFFEGTGGAGFVGIKDSDDGTIGYIGVDGGSLLFQTSGSSYSTKLAINAAGNVGIGTTSPTNPLTVQANSGAGAVALNGRSSDGIGTFSFYANNGTTSQGYVQGRSDSLRLWAASGDYLSLGSSDTECMRIDTSGNVGIGNTIFTSARVNAPHLVVGDATNSPGLTLLGGTGEQASINFADATSGTGGYDGGFVYGFGSGTPYMTFHVNGGTERMRIDASGALFVGATSASSSATGVKIQPNGYGGISAAVNLVGSSSGSSNSGFSQYSTGAGAYRFYVDYAGTIFATSTSISAISDVSLKENVRDLDKGLDTINALQPRRFDWKNGDGNDIMGFIAQEVEGVIPELVHDYKYKDEEIKKGLKMGDMVPSMVKAIQELSAQVNELKAEVAALKGE